MKGFALPNQEPGTRNLELDMLNTMMNDLLPWILLLALTGGWLLDHTTRASTTATPPAPSQAAVPDTVLPGAVFAWNDLVAQREASGRPYLPFLDVPTLRAGLYALPAGGTDEQQPHDKDEVYYVVQGQAGITIDDTSYTVQPGSVIFVPAHAVHHFHDITEDLQLLVFFSEAEPTPSDE